MLSESIDKIYKKNSLSMICVSHKSSTIKYDIKEFRVLIKKICTTSVV